jgi:hypothetical protein
MNRREFLTGAAAVGAATVAIPAAPAAAAAQLHHVAPRRPQAPAPGSQSGTWRLEYPRTPDEISGGLFARNLTFPPGDPRRY